MGLRTIKSCSVQLFLLQIVNLMKIANIFWKTNRTKYWTKIHFENLNFLTKKKQKTQKLDNV